jgi:hypothetical protein
MSLYKAISSGKEKRKNYFGAKSYDCSCRNHGGCSYCLDNRMYKNKKRESSSKDKLNGNYSLTG